jgi:hypothetical protein
MSQISYEGDLVKDETLNKLIAYLNKDELVENDHVHALMIKNTAIKKLPTELFTKIQFDKIIIEDNVKLSNVTSQKGTVKSENLVDLIIQNTNV